MMVVEDRWSASRLVENKPASTSLNFISVHLHCLSLSFFLLPSSTNNQTTTITMFSSARTRLSTLSTRSSASHFLPRAYYSSTTPRLAENFAPVNDPTPPKNPPPNVSETNEVPVDSQGARDAPLQESTTEGQRVREMQAPNREKTWSRSQQTREKAMTGPRFEQTIMEYQVGFGDLITFGICLFPQGQSEKDNVLTWGVR